MRSLDLDGVVILTGDRHEFSMQCTDEHWNSLSMFMSSDAEFLKHRSSLSGGQKEIMDVGLGPFFTNKILYHTAGKDLPQLGSEISKCPLLICLHTVNIPHWIGLCK